MKLILSLLLILMALMGISQETRTQLIERINAYESLKIDKFGNLEVDGGSASAGRFNLNLNEVHSIKLEFRGEEPGCADYCPQFAYISFECKDDPCAWDPGNGRHDKREHASVQFTLYYGLEVYLALTAFKYFDFIDLSEIEIKKR